MEKEPVANNVSFSPDGSRSGHYLLLSFDLTNATSFKSKISGQGGEWAPVIGRFYQEAANVMLKFDFTIWKYQGDEVLGYLMIEDDTRFRKIPRQVLELWHDLRELNEKLKKSNPDLSVKAALWHAHVSTASRPRVGGAFGDLQKNPDSLGGLASARNIIFETDWDNLDNGIEFLGPDIDLGFRICAHSRNDVIAISAGLAYSLLKIDESDDSKEKSLNDLRIVDYLHLKGIWNGKLYPIIWFFREWANIESELRYDEPFVSSIIKNIFVMKVPEKPIDVGALESVLHDANVLDSCKAFLKDFRLEDNG